MSSEGICGIEEELQKKHRQERKELQGKIQSLKKTVPKGDKKRKKEIADTIAKLEQELNEKHNQELSDFQPSTDEYEETANIEDAKIEDAGNENNEEECSDEKDSPPRNIRVTRAQRRRNKKSVEEKERDDRITQQEVKNKSGPRVIELNAIKEILKSVGLELYNVPPDGNCLYCAINHQLEVTGRESSNVEQLRKLTADFIRQHKDEFLPFLYSDSGEIVSDKYFEEYCNDIEKTKFWGGQIELRALSNILQCPIKVIQSTGPTTIQGENFSGSPLIITYHRHLYKLGEHYNSTVVMEINCENE